MTERANRLGDQTRRKHTPALADPAIVVVVDELADLGAYLKGELGQRPTRPIQRITSQGRAPGVCLMGLVQDPRKETLPFRPLFPDKIAGPLRHRNFMARHFKPAVKAAGLPDKLRFHDLRHTAAAFMIAEGASMEQVKQILGTRRSGSRRTPTGTCSRTTPTR